MKKDCSMWARMLDCNLEMPLYFYPHGHTVEWWWVSIIHDGTEIEWQSSLCFYTVELSFHGPSNCHFSKTLYKHFTLPIFSVWWTQTFYSLHSTLHIISFLPWGLKLVCFSHCSTKLYWHFKRELNFTFSVLQLWTNDQLRDQAHACVPGTGEESIIARWDEIYHILWPLLFTIGEVLLWFPHFAFLPFSPCLSYFRKQGIAKKTWI